MMRNSLLIFIIVWTSLLTPFSFAIPRTNKASTPSNVQAKMTTPVPVYSQDKQTILVTSSQPGFIYKLKSNPTTGYSWFLREYDPRFITPVNHRFEKGEGNLMGAPGFEYFTFRVKAVAFDVPHQTIIRFTYVRPWQSDDNGAQLLLRVTTISDKDNNSSKESTKN